MTLQYTECADRHSFFQICQVNQQQQQQQQQKEYVKKENPIMKNRIISTKSFSWMKSKEPCSKFIYRTSKMIVCKHEDTGIIKNESKTFAKKTGLPLLPLLLSWVQGWIIPFISK